MKTISIHHLKKQIARVDCHLAPSIKASVAYVHLGERAKPCLVMCQGSNLNLFAWDGVLLKRLLSHFSLFLFDYPGLTGLSDLVGREDYSVLVQAQILDHCLKKLAIRPFALLGYSMGGWVALSYSVLFPPSALVLIATDGGGVKAKPPSEYLERWALLDEAHDIAEKREVLKLIFPGKMSLCRKISLGCRFFAAGKIGRLPRGEVLDRQNRLYEAWYTGESIAPNVHIPSLVLLPEKDNILPVSTQEALVKDLPCSTVRRFERMGHGLPYHDPNGVAQAIIRFLTEERI